MLWAAQTMTPEARTRFGLFRNPFLADLQGPEDVYLWPDFRYAREAMWDAAKHGAFRAIVGESGSGKSTLREDLAERIKREKQAIILIEPYVVGMEESDGKGKPLKSAQIAEAMVRALDPHASLRSMPDARFHQAHKALIASSQAGYRHLLIIEEAHCLPLATLKHLKRWRELRDGLRSLLGIILIGQQELAGKLDGRNPAVREVAQRCEVVELLPLDAHVPEYIQHKLARAGVAPEKIYRADAYDALRARLTLTRGEGKEARPRSMCYPLALNNLCVRSMNAAAEVGASVVSGDIVREC